MTTPRRPGAVPTLSVVVAHAPGAPMPPALAGAAWLRALQRSCAGLDAELLLSGFDEATCRDAEGADMPCTIVPTPRSALTPARWARGLEVAGGRIVAFTTDLCHVEAGWARAAVAAIDGGATAVGGPIVPGPSLSRVGRAIYQLRFGRLPRRDVGTIPVDDVAADNAAYVRATLLAEGGEFHHGFWEVEPNRRLRAAGHTLVFAGAMVASFAGGEPLRTLLGQRFAHGRWSGAWRVAIRVRRTWQVVLASPLVPLVLLARTLRAHPARTPSAIPIPEFLLLASAWAAGEALGAVAPPRGRRG